MRTVFKTGALTLHAECHLRGLRFHTEPVHHLAEVRIRYPVKHDKPCVYSIGFIITLYIYRMGMSPYIIVGFKHFDVMFAMQEVRCGHT